MELTPEVKLEDHLDGSKVEQEMLEAVQKESIDILGIALRTYHLNLQALKAKLPLLKSGRGKMRLLNLLIEYPLNDTNLKAHTNIEKELFALADACLQSKYMVMMYQFASNGDQLIKAAEEKVAEEIKEVKPEVVVSTAISQVQTSP